MTDEAPKEIARGTGSRARSLARKLVMQALYQWQMTQQPAVEIKQQILESEDSAGVDEDHFVELLTQIIARQEEIKTALKPFVDRPLEQLDPVEAAILMVGLYEMKNRLDIPYRVVINEGVDLCKRFGATDAHKYINAVLDRAAKEIRAAERR